MVFDVLPHVWGTDWLIHAYPSPPAEHVRYTHDDELSSVEGPWVHSSFLQSTGEQHPSGAAAALDAGEKSELPPGATKEQWMQHVLGRANATLGIDEPAIKSTVADARESLEAVERILALKRNAAAMQSVPPTTSSSPWFVSMFLDLSWAYFQPEPERQLIRTSHERSALATAHAFLCGPNDDDTVRSDRSDGTAWRFYSFGVDGLFAALTRGRPVEHDGTEENKVGGGSF
eukprot:TRINITY_DN57391_c0_g1_i1.p1 TRINITY_DN57391_c0_g1~~TRINITY_DN57391_c0_g1_i1.p1  ORF type:complete len:231 (-),score=22.18 TRINITY_DN57391_c0_g1_i1:451-1143(-)